MSYKGVLGLPEATVDPDLLLLPAVLGHPMHSSTLSAVTRPHQDKIFALHFLLHHLNSTINRNQNLWINIVFTHLLHHLVNQVIVLLRPLISSNLVTVIELQLHLLSLTPSRAHLGYRGHHRYYIFSFSANPANCQPNLI